MEVKLRNHGLQPGERWISQEDPKWLALCEKEEELEKKSNEESFISKLEKVNPTLAKKIVKEWNDSIKWCEEMEKQR